jgi:putative sporulation protein YtaF
MPNIFDSLFLSLSTNIDNMAVGIAYGCNRDMGFDANLIIALLSFLSTFVSMSIGSALAKTVPQQLGPIILLIIGLYMTYQAIYDSQSNHVDLENSDNNDKSKISLDLDITSTNQKDKSRKKRITLREATMLGLALTFTNFGTGIGGGLANLNVVRKLFACLSTCVCVLKMQCFHQFFAI